MNLLDRIPDQGLLLDGALGTELQRKRLPAGTGPDLWNLENPQAVKEVHASYIEAGSDAISANTFGSNPLRFAAHKSNESWETVTRQGIVLAKEAASNRVLVAGDIGPSGLLLAPMGPAMPEEVERSFAAQARVMDEEGVDFFIAETFFSLQEILLAARAIRSMSERPVFLSLTFEKKRRGYFTIMGDSIADAMKAMAETGATAVGANCSLGSTEMVEVAREIRQAVSIPVIIQPNAGLPTMTPGGAVYPEDVETFAANILRIRQLGVEIVGGCCGTRPETIAAIRAQWK
ncbi:MAG: methionine synthase I, cobalamin-binding domain-containing protein [Calditrichaeota bacterium]|nr:methionine synthase I, cobalamin-binding domain-containing protein [Calditrichota bacterium]